MAERIRVSVVYAGPQRQIVREIEVAVDASVDDAIRASGILADLPDGFTAAGIGVFGSHVARDARLRDGDRIELYRPLLIDPKEARRRRAKR
jgi:putative ubiquitin-RnfH superfamily antitoxin RatB of RatAB toxin-antitoxin module